MFSKKTLQILYDFKYQLQRLQDATKTKPELKARLASFKQALADYTPSKNTQTMLNTKEKILADLKYLMPLLKNNIKSSLEKKFNAGGFATRGGASDYDFEFNLGDNIPSHLIWFLKQPLNAQEISVYAALEKQNKPASGGKRSFLSSASDAMGTMMEYLRQTYNKKKWDYWYWPNLYYGKNSWKIFPFVFFKFLSEMGVSILGLTLGAAFLPGPLLYIVCGMTGVLAFTIPQTNVEKLILLVVAAAIIALIIFCPPISVGLIFGASLSFWAATAANAGLLMAFMLVAKGLDYASTSMLEPKIDQNVENLFIAQASSSKAPPTLKGVDGTATQSILKELANRPTLTIKIDKVARSSNDTQEEKRKSSEDSVNEEDLHEGSDTPRSMASFKGIDH